MKRFISRGLFIFGGTLALAACSRQSEGPVVAKVGSESLTMSDVRARLQDTPAAYQQYLASPDGRKQFMNLLIREKVLLAAAKQSGLQNDTTYKQAVQQFKERIQQRVRDYSESLLVDSYLRKLRSGELSVPDADVRRYFDAHSEEFQKPMEIQASHILVNNEADAQRALSRVKAGEPFDKVAKEMSQDPATAIRGGALTPFRRGTLVPEFEEAVFKLKVGEISGLVKTQFGFHIIKKTGQKMLPSQSFDQAKEEIRARLEREKFDQWVTKKQEAMGVKVDDRAMAALSQIPAPGSPEEPR